MNVTIAELYPNAWGCVTTFLILCKVLGVKPTLTAFSYIFCIRLCSSEEHGAGWITFSHRRGFRKVGKLPDNQKGYRTKFVFLYNFQPWKFKTSFDIKPKVNKFKNNVPQCTVDEAVIIEYTLMAIEQGRNAVHVHNNWISKKNILDIEDLISAFEISLKIHKRKFLDLFSY